MGRTGRTLVVGFDAVVMGIAAYREVGVPTNATPAVLVLWGAALAAAVCAVAVYTSGSPVIAWAAIGYVLFGALLTGQGAQWPLVALAVALMPLVPRPRGSLWLGLGISAAVALATRAVITTLS